jgi:hypothetical protein
MRTFADNDEEGIMKAQVRSVMVLVPALMLVATTAKAGGLVNIPFDAHNFTNPLDINNPYFPLVPGTTFVYRTASGKDCQVDDFEVTSNTKVIAGVVTREIHDQVWEDVDCNGTRGALLEDTLDWHAQDDAGNVWYFGEFTNKATPGCTPPGQTCDTSGSFEAGADVANIGSTAEAGIIMLAHPRPGDFYSQEFYEGEAEDQGKVMRLNAKVSLTLDNQIDPDKYAGCLDTKETSPLEKGVVEHKFYCKGINGTDAGVVVIEEHHGKTVRTELVEVTHN